MFVVRLAVQVFQIRACQRYQRHEGPIRVVQPSALLAPPANVRYRNASLHRTVVVEVHERRNEVLQILLRDLVLQARLEAAVDVDEKIAHAQRSDRQALQHRPQLLDGSGGLRAFLDLCREPCACNEMPHERLLVHFHVPHARVAVVFARYHHGMPDDPGSILGLDLSNLVRVETKLHAHDDSRRLLVNAPILNISLARIVLEVEVAAGHVHMIQPLQRREKRGLPRLVLAYQAGDLVDVHPPRVVDATVVGYPCSR